MTNCRWKTVLTMTVALTFMSCKESTSGPPDDDAEMAVSKMKLVLAKMAEDASEPNDKGALESAKIFVHLKGFDMPVVGAAVPNRLTGKRILVSFTKEHFQEGKVDALAREGLADLTRAMKLSEAEKASGVERSSEK
jgi:hypothetical protein